MISAARALIWHLFFTQEPFNLFPSLLDLCIFSPSAKPIFFIGRRDLLTGVGQVSRTKLSNMADSSVFCSVRSKVYPGFPLCFCLFRRHPIMQHRSVCAVSRAKSTRRTRRRQFENQTSSLMNRQNPSSVIVQKCSRTSFAAIRIDLLNANLNSTRWFETVQRGSRVRARTVKLTAVSDGFRETIFRKLSNKFHDLVLQIS